MALIKCKRTYVARCWQGLNALAPSPFRECRIEGGLATGDRAKLLHNVLHDSALLLRLAIDPTAIFGAVLFQELLQWRPC